jgi:Tfp pilus assembly protein PilO
MNNTQSKKIKIYIVPIITLVVFVAIIIFLIIPKISEIFGGLDSINRDNQAITDVNALTAELEALQARKDSIEADLADLNNITSGGTTRVVEFRDKIASILLSYNLDIDSQNISESSFLNADLNTDVVLIEIPFDFAVTGTLEDTKAFINALSSIEDFAIVKELDITKGDGDQWIMNIILIKYQFGTNPEEEQIYLGVGLNSTIPDNIRGYLDSRE